MNKKYVDITIELSLEEWGQVALIAHSRNQTINDTINFILEKYIKSEENNV